MALVMIRGSAITWVYLCEQCKKKLWGGFGERKKPKCELCNEKFDAPLSIRFCNSCSYETSICMGCGAKVKIKDDYETFREKALTSKPKPSKRKPRKKRPK